MPFFQPPLRLDDFPRASSAFPVASTSAARLPDSPSPNKKRRVGSVPPSLATGQRGHGSAQSKATSQRCASDPTPSRKRRRGRADLSFSPVRTARLLARKPLLASLRRTQPAEAKSMHATPS
jgi:hypothetical protein